MTYTDALEERMIRQFPAWRDLGLAGGNPLTTTFPGQALRTRAMIALNPDFTQEYTTWNWVDITRTVEGTSIVRWEQQINIIFGGRANSPVADASTCKFRATNDKRFSRRNPLGPYYGQLSEYTPLWIQLDYGQGWKDRYFGFIHDFSKAWDRSGNDPYIDLTARGPFHRIGKSKPLKSPIYRAISGVAADDFKPHGFWPGEDASGATQIASALPNQPAVIPLGPTTYGQEGPAGALSVITAGEGFSASFPVVPYEDTDRWAVTWIMQINSKPASNTTTLLTVHTTGGDLPTWRLILDTTFGDTILRWNAYDASDVLQYGVFFFPVDVDANFYGQWFMLTFGVHHPTAFPGNAQSTMAVDNGRDERFHATNGALFAGHVGTITDFTFTIDTVLSTVGVALGEFGVFVDPNFRPFNTAAAQENGDALHGYELEPAVTRLRRICREERIPFFSLAVEAESALCGPQQTGSLLNNLRIPELADRGTLYEYKFGLAYKPPSEYQNQPVHLTLDAALSQVKDIGSPIDNDLDFVNRWTVTRQGGSSATAEGRKGEAGITLTDTELVYENAKTVSVGLDSQLADYASSLVAQTTVDEDRWPTVGFKLEASPELIDAWINFPFGGRINALDLYEEIGVTTLDQIHKGHTESWNSLMWNVSMNVGPASVFTTQEIDNDDYGRMDSDSSRLALDITSSATDFIVDTTDDSELWATIQSEPEDFPMDVKLYPGVGEAISSGGETMVIDSIESAVRDTFSRVEVNQWGTSDSLHPWTLVSGAAVADFSVTGSAGRMANSVVNTEYITTVDLGYARHQKIRLYNLLSVTPTGNPINWGGILRCQNLNNLWWIDVQVSTAGVLTIRAISKKHGANVQEATAVSATVHSAAVERILVAEITETNLIRAKVYANGSPEPGWELTFQDTSGDLVAGTQVGCISRLMTGNTNALPVNVDFDNFAVLNPQEFHVDTRATNGIVKAHKAGTYVRIDPMSTVG